MIDEREKGADSEPRPMVEDVRVRADLSAQVVAIADELREIDVHAYEGNSTNAVRDELVPAVVQATDSAIALCGAVLEAHDDDAKEDKLAESASSMLADLAFVGKVSLRPSQAGLARLSDHDEQWEIVAECGSAQRRVIKTLSALESAIAQSEGRTSRLASLSDLGRSLQTRKHYRALRRAINAEPFTAERAIPVMRRIGTEIAMLVGREIYPNFRISDRRLLRSLQDRLLSWLRDSTDNRSWVQAGQRLYQDLVAFSGLIAQVRRRQELVEHDGHVLERLQGLRTAGDCASATIRELLHSLVGLDDELDELLEEHHPEFDWWHDTISRLHQEMCR